MVSGGASPLVFVEFANARVAWTRSIETTVYVEREHGEVAITVSGQVEFRSGPPLVEDFYACDADGVEFDLDEGERDHAQQCLIDAAAADDSEECAAEMRWEQRRDDRERAAEARGDAMREGDWR
jgi:hypothetical protein